MDAVQEFDQLRTLPALRFAGAQGWITSETVGSGLASHKLRQCESSTYPDPSRRDLRTHAAYAAAEFSGKHLVSYVEQMQMSGKAASTIKTDLAGIRFFHDLMDAKYHLPSNDELGIALERRRFGQVDRTWTPPEFNRLLAAALREDRYDYILAFYLARYAGLRIHECFRIDTAIAENALRENAITIKGKGGKIRTVPINDAIAVALRKQLSRTERGHKLLVPDSMPTDDAIYRVQSSCWIIGRSSRMGVTAAL